MLVIAVAFLLMLFPNSAKGDANAPKPDSVSPFWNTDLHAAVGSLPLGLIVGQGHETTLQPKTSLWFCDNDTIVATFVTQEEKATLSSRDNSDPNQPLRLRGIFVDANTGKITSTRVWPTSSRFAGVVAATDQGFVTQRGITLTLYSSGARELKTLSLPPLPTEFWGWQAHPSPTGKRILFATSDLTPTTSPRTWILLDTNSLQVVRSREEVQSGWVGISDVAVAMTACTIWFYHCEPKVEIRDLTGEWETLAPLKIGATSFPQFINEDIFFVSGEPWKLLQTSGKAILTENVPFEGSTAVSSAGGQRFVVPFFRLTGRVAALDIGGHGELKTISIYDAPFRERSYRLRVKSPKITERALLALSPDGSKLAVLYDETLYVFQLPLGPGISSPTLTRRRSDNSNHWR